MKTSEGGSVGLRSDLQMVKDVEGRVRTRLGRMIWDLKWEHYEERKHVYFFPGERLMIARGLGRSRRKGRKRRRS